MTAIWPSPYNKSQRELFPAMESRVWEDNLSDTLSILNDWLDDPINIHDAIASVEEVLRKKHHDYGETNLLGFGELGILVRASDKVARLKNLLETEAEVDDETRFDTWRDLAGYAIQALIFLQYQWGEEDTKKAEEAELQFRNIFEIRKNRLTRGYCPDCGQGVILRESLWYSRMRCSENCGFHTGDLARICEGMSFEAMIDYLASQPAYLVQK